MNSTAIGWSKSSTSRVDDLLIRLAEPCRDLAGVVGGERAGAVQPQDLPVGRAGVHADRGDGLGGRRRREHGERELGLRERGEFGVAACPVGVFPVQSAAAVQRRGNGDHTGPVRPRQGLGERSDEQVRGQVVDLEGQFVTVLGDGALIRSGDHDGVDQHVEYRMDFRDLFGHEDDLVEAREVRSHGEQVTRVGSVGDKLMHVLAGRQRS
ncbi:hypothetical protein GCM10009609_75410 [Pseudonocardia aurantiaca]